MNVYRWTICPKCNYRDPDSLNNDDEVQGSLRLDLDVDNSKTWFALRIICSECGFKKVFTHHALDL